MAVDTELTWNGDKVIKNVNLGTIRALVKSGLLVESTAKILTPVDTGNLRSSIARETDVSKLEEIVYTNVEYAKHVEFGTKHQDAQPYMRPALQDNIRNIEKIFIEEERKAID